MEQISAFSELGKLGVLGIVLSISLWWNWKFLNKLNECWAGRVEDWKALAEIIRLNSVTSSEMIASNDARTRAAEALARAQDLAAASQTGLTAEVARLRAEIEKLRETGGRS
jgi:hypothetical protein